MGLVAFVARNVPFSDASPLMEASTSTYLLAAAVLFFVVSFVLNRWPQLVWRTQQVFDRPPRNIAHRGGQAERAENTLLAFDYAVHDVQCPMIELDVVPTADGYIVVAHDDDLYRITGKHQRITETKYAELPMVLDSNELAKVPMEFIPTFEGFPVPFGPQHIPLLEEVFIRFPATIINIDIKCGKETRVIEETVALLHKYNRVNRTIFGGFDQEILDRLRKCDENIIVSAGPERVCKIVLAYYLGVLPFMNIWERVWEVPIFRSSFETIWTQEALEKQNKLPKWCGRFIRTYYQFVAWLAYRFSTNPAFVAALKRRGLIVFGWLANTSEEFRDGFLRIGCDGLMTDRPSQLRKWLHEERMGEAESDKKNI